MNTNIQICQEIFDARHEEQINALSAYNPFFRSKNQTVSPFYVDVQNKAFNEQHPDLVDCFADFAVESEVKL